MDIVVSGKVLDVTDKLSAYITDKFVKMERQLCKHLEKMYENRRSRQLAEAVKAEGVPEPGEL